ncbi:MAG: helix-turn-helix domain-containing protein [Thermoanaerobaculum sp.]|nr:helix-turn-helix domain-containing protein [Thermoanaerobaculum sp.]
MLGHKSASPGSQVGRLIREHRTRRQLTQTELARQIGISQSDLSRMEKGEYRVPLDVLFRILRAFELSLGEFFGELNHQSLTPEERKLLDLFRRLSREGQEELLAFAEFKLSREGQ